MNATQRKDEIEMPTPDQIALRSLPETSENIRLSASYFRVREMHRDLEAKAAKTTAEHNALLRKNQEAHAQIVEGIAQKRAEMLVVTDDLEKARKEFERVDREVKKRQDELNKLDRL
jgi:hypothetical protein